MRDNYERIDDELWEALGPAKYAVNAQGKYSALGVKRMSRQEHLEDERQLIADGKDLHIPLSSIYSFRAMKRGLDIDSSIIDDAMNVVIEKPAMLFS